MIQHPLDRLNGDYRDYRAQDREGRAIRRAALEVEGRRRQRVVVIWGLSLSICAGFGWLTLLATMLRADPSFGRLSLNALAAFLASALCLIYLARPHRSWLADQLMNQRYQILGGILYLSALGGLALLALWVTLFAILREIAVRWAPAGTMPASGAWWIWLVSATLGILIWASLIALAVRLLAPGRHG